MSTRTRTRTRTREDIIFPTIFSEIKPSESVKLVDGQTIEFQTNPPLRMKGIELGRSIVYNLNMQWDENRQKWYAERTTEGTEVATVKAYKPDSDTYDYLQLDSSKNLKVVDSNSESMADDSIKGLLRTLGDAGNSPSNTSGQTMLKKLNEIQGYGSSISTVQGHQDDLYGSTTLLYSARESLNDTEDKVIVNQDVSGMIYSKIKIGVYFALNGNVWIYWSADGTNWGTVENIAVTGAAIPTVIERDITLKYVKIHIYNGGGATQYLSSYVQLAQ